MPDSQFDMLAGQPAKQQHWDIYAITAKKDGEPPHAYVGKAINLGHRLRDHHFRQRPLHGSWEVAEWAKVNRVPLRVKFLERVHDKAMGIKLEGLWIDTLQNAGIILDAVERWHPNRNKSRRIFLRQEAPWVPDVQELCVGPRLRDVAWYKLKLAPPQEPSPLFSLVSELALQTTTPNRPISFQNSLQPDGLNQ